VGIVDLEEANGSNLLLTSPIWLWIGVLVASTVAVAFESEIFVGVVEEAQGRD